MFQRIEKISLKHTVFFRLPPDQLAEYPAWLIVFLSQIILPMIGFVVIAIKIIMRNGRDMSRELLGARFQSTLSNSSNGPLGENISLKTLFDHSNAKEMAKNYLPPRPKSSFQ